jgi:hypothetical protein
MRYDLEEIAPNRFIVRDARASTLLKGEGELAGNRFTLTSWRRAGLLARLRERGFRVMSLDDQIDGLAAPPDPPPLGPPLWRPLASPAERLSSFDVQALAWRPLEPEQRGTPGVMIRPGSPVRRRRGRGPAEFFLAHAERSGVGLRPLDEDQAILAGYAQAGAGGPIDLHASPAEGGLLLPDLTLPPSYRSVLGRIATAGPEGWSMRVTDRPFVEALLARLGARLVTPRAE